MKEIFVIDNYDSFTYNLVHCIEELGYKTTVKRNDKFELNELEDFQNILLSPGPGIPDESGLLKNAIKHYSSTKIQHFKNTSTHLATWALVKLMSIHIRTALPS